jgi:hypothetical protein
LGVVICGLAICGVGFATGDAFWGVFFGVGFGVGFDVASAFLGLGSVSLPRER